MTLILSVATHDCVYQVGDKRLVGTDGRVYTEDRVKQVLFNGVTAFGMTGLALIDGTRTDHWLTKTLSHPSCLSNSSAANYLAEAASNAIKATPTPANLERSRVTRMAFCAVGWSATSETTSVPMILRVSNFHDKTGRVLDRAMNQFDIQVTIATPSDRFVMLETGQSIPAALVSKLRRKLRQLIKGHASQETIIKYLVGAVWAAAVRNKMVGQELLSVCIPKGTQSEIQSRNSIMMLTGAPGPNCATFQSWSGRGYSGAIDGPHFVIGGRMYSTDLRCGTGTKFEVPRAQKRALGGLRIEKGIPARIVFPCCIYVDDSTDSFLSARSEHCSADHLAIFTDEQAVTATMKQSENRMRRVMIEDHVHLAEILRNTPNCRQIVLDPNGPRGTAFVTSTETFLRFLDKHADCLTGTNSLSDS